MRSYYHVAIASSTYKQMEPLTYHYDHNAARLQVGQLVFAELRGQLVSGLILKEVDKPAFATKSLTSVPALPPLPLPLLQTLRWLQAYYGANVGNIMSLALPSGLTHRTAQSPASNDVATHFNDTSLPPLSKQQSSIYQKLPETGSALIHGDTGTGKTRLYIEKCLEVVKSGRSAIVLTPEISLTSQLLMQFQVAFGERVLLTHSSLTSAKRRQIWLRALTTKEPLVLIGPRSALMLPLHSLGVIVIDESHDDAYKQEGTPGYHAVRLAAQLATEHKALLLLGSATPSVSDYFLLQQKKRPIFRLTDKPLVGKSHEVLTTIVDIKDRTAFAKHPSLSNLLLENIQVSLQQKEQILLFLNRRGTARITLCDHCGWRALCKHCGTPLTFHEDTFSLRCHTCGRAAMVPSSCPDCDNTSILFRQNGTKMIEAQIKKLFPSARTMRFDTDNAKAERFEQHYDAVRRGEVDILIGTQLLVKGLDLPKLNLVGVLNADLSLQMPDFTAEEKTYQLLSQIKGRVGRGHSKNPAHVVVQSFRPDNFVVQAALTGKWQDYYQRELNHRRLFAFPPYCQLLKLTIRRKTAAGAEKKATEMLQYIQHNFHVIAEGPLPSYQNLVHNKHQWHIFIKATQRHELLAIVKGLPNDWYYDLDPLSSL